MATIIPTEGELSEHTAPKNPDAVRAALGADALHTHTAPDGSTWWVSDPPLVGDVMFNERASRFFHSRTGYGNAASVTLYGKVLYMSADETKILNGVKTTDEMLPIRGRTYEVRDKLKAIGARWYSTEKVWKIAKSKLDEAEVIVKKGP